MLTRDKSIGKSDLTDDECDQNISIQSDEKAGLTKM